MINSMFESLGELLAGAVFMLIVVAIFYGLFSVAKFFKKS